MKKFVLFLIVASAVSASAAPVPNVNDSYVRNQLINNLVGSISAAQLPVTANPPILDLFLKGELASIGDFSFELSSVVVIDGKPGVEFRGEMKTDVKINGTWRRYSIIRCTLVMVYFDEDWGWINAQPQSSKHCAQ